MADSKYQFDVIVITPGHLDHAQTAIAAAKAGGLGVLDYTFSPANTPAQREHIQANLKSLLTGTKPEHRIGLKLSIAQTAGTDQQQGSLLADLLPLLAGRKAWLILCTQGRPELPPVKDFLPVDWEGNILIQASESQGLQQAIQNMEYIQGVIVRGHECGGFTGAESAFLLTQKASKLFQDSGLAF
ncbi:MAG: hypothetical protein ABR533_04395, partial [Desulfonatronovibrio sp.]